MTDPSPALVYRPVGPALLWAALVAAVWALFLLPWPGPATPYRIIAACIGGLLALGQARFEIERRNRRASARPPWSSAPLKTLTGTFWVVLASCLVLLALVEGLSGIGPAATFADLHALRDALERVAAIASMASPLLIAASGLFLGLVLFGCRSRGWAAWRGAERVRRALKPWTERLSTACMTLLAFGAVSGVALPNLAIERSRAVSQRLVIAESNWRILYQERRRAVIKSLAREIVEDAALRCEDQTPCDPLVRVLTMHADAGEIDVWWRIADGEGGLGLSPVDQQLFRVSPTTGVPLESARLFLPVRPAPAPSSDLQITPLTTAAMIAEKRTRDEDDNLQAVVRYALDAFGVVAPSEISHHLGDRAGLMVSHILDQPLGSLREEIDVLALRSALMAVAGSSQSSDLPSVSRSELEQAGLLRSTARLDDALKAITAPLRAEIIAGQEILETSGRRVTALKRRCAPFRPRGEHVERSSVCDRVRQQIRWETRPPIASSPLAGHPSYPAPPPPRPRCRGRGC